MGRWRWGGGRQERAGGVGRTKGKENQKKIEEKYRRRGVRTEGMRRKNRVKLKREKNRRRVKKGTRGKVLIKYELMGGTVVYKLVKEQWMTGSIRR